MSWPLVYIRSPGKTLGFPREEVLRCEDQPRRGPPGGLRPSRRANAARRRRVWANGRVSADPRPASGGCGAPSPPRETDGTNPVREAAEHRPRRGPGQRRAGAGFASGLTPKMVPQEVSPHSRRGDTTFSLIFPHRPHRSQTLPWCAAL